MTMGVTKPTVARLPFMIKSSKWDVIGEGLKWVQGRSLVNPISLKVGELFIEPATTKCASASAGKAACVRRLTFHPGGLHL